MVAASLAACVVGGQQAVRARPVTIGVYQELPFGVARSHPSITEGGRPARDNRSLVRLAAREPSPVYTTRVGADAAASPVALTNNAVLVATSDTAAYVSAAGALEPGSVSLHGGAGVSLTPGGGYVIAETDGLLFLGAALSDAVRVPVGGLSPHAPLVLEDGSVVVSAGARVLRVDAQGRELFSLPVASRAQSPIARTPAGLLVVATTDELIFLDEAGAIERREPLGNPPVAGPAVALDGTVWMLTRHELVAYEASRGVRVRVRAPGAGPVTHGGLAIASDGSVRAAILGSGVLALNASGVELFHVSLDLARFVVVDLGGTSLALTQDGVLLAIDSAGEERWRTRVTGGGANAAPVIGVDGTIYVGLRGGSLAALR